jgi:hypothetical protein
MALGVVGQRWFTASGQRYGLGQSHQLHLTPALVAPGSRRPAPTNEQEPVGLDGDFRPLWVGNRSRQSLCPVAKA